jgi:hypothetical protein
LNLAAASAAAVVGAAALYAAARGKGVPPAAPAAEPEHAPASSEPAGDSAELRERRNPRAAMEPLDSEKLVARTSEVSPTGYLTIISVLQGVAAATLAANVFTASPKGPRSDPLTWIQAIAVLAILAFVFHFYIAASPFTRWPPSFLDSLLPFIVGGFEVPPAFYLGTGAPWCVSVAALCVMAAGGLVTTGISTGKDHFGQGERPAHAHRVFRRILVWIGAIAVVTAAAVSACVPLMDDTRAGLLWGGVVAAGVVIGAIGLMAALMERALCEIYGDYDVARPFFL